MSKREHNVLNLNDKVKIVGLLKGIMSLAEVEQLYGEISQAFNSTILNSMNPKNSWFLFSTVCLKPYTCGSTITL
jgi:hypothetical protein